MTQLLIFIGFISIVVSCSSDEREPIVDLELMGFVTSFVEEGKKRGVELSIQGLEANLVNEFSMEFDESVCGWGNYYNNNNQRIEILLRDDCWGELTDIEKENLMYHELGHALLRRGHLNQTLPNHATQKSIMCSKVCSNFRVFTEDGKMRSYYLDELFNELTPFPSSITNKEAKQIVYEENFEEDNGDYITLSFDGTETAGDFLIERDSVFVNSKVVYGLQIENPTPQKDSVIVFRSFELPDFEPCSNLKANASFISADFKGRINIRIIIQDNEANANFSGLYNASRTYEGTKINEGIEIELYSIPQNKDLVTIAFTIYSPEKSNVFLDRVQVELLE